MEALRHLCNPLPDLPESSERGTGTAAPRIVRVARGLDVGPTPVEPVGAVRLVTLAGLELGIELGAPIQAHLLDLTLGDDILSDELLGVDLRRGRVLADGPVHQRLSE